jgi:hypothetical protein
MSRSSRRSFLKTVAVSALTLGATRAVGQDADKNLRKR